MENIEKLAVALVKVQAEIRVAKKGSVLKMEKEGRTLFQTKYADLGAVWEACHEALTKNGIAVVQAPRFDAGVQRLVTHLIHESGQSISGEYLIRPVKDDPQGMGSAFTYARRHSLCAMVGIISEDDDGKIASTTRGKNGPTSKVAAALLDKEISATDRKGLAHQWRTVGITDSEAAEYLQSQFGYASTGEMKGRDMVAMADWIKTRKK